jgi:hypothetical protein
MEVRKPIIIVGTGRCGSTLLFRLLAMHPNVGWLSTFNEVFPTQLWLSRFSGLYRHRALGHSLRHQSFFPKPFEAYRFWEHYLPGFSRRDSPLTAADVPTEAIRPVRQSVSRILDHMGRKRFLIKVTGWARIAYFDRIFPDARFIWLQREPRAVISSWIRADWLDVTSSPDSDGWQWGEIPPAYHQIWQELGGDDILSAALKVQLDLDNIRENMALFPDRCHTITFNDLVEQPLDVMSEVCRFSELSWSKEYQNVIANHKFYNPNNKWRRYLSEEDGERILEFFRRANAVAAPMRQKVEVGA